MWRSPRRASATTALKLQELSMSHLSNDRPAPNGSAPVALVTGAAVRIGAEIARVLHARGFSVVLHHNRSADAARTLAGQLNDARPDSALGVQADLLDLGACQALMQQAIVWKQRLDVLVNNASSFYPTPIGTTTEAQWNDLTGTNLKAPFFLAQAGAEALRASGGAIVNLVDIHAERPIPEHPVYCAAKAGLVALTRALARDLAPAVRVNAIAPGAILWPAGEADEDNERKALAGIPLGTMGSPGEIARTVEFLVAQSSYVTGQIIAVDGGRSLT
jgi:pteridine reductase